MMGMLIVIAIVLLFVFLMIGAASLEWDTNKGIKNLANLDKLIKEKK